MALPFTSGYYSKHEILAAAHQVHFGLWLAGVTGALLTAVYTSRLVIIAFFGSQNTKPHERREPVIIVPLIILAALAIFGAHLQTPLASVFVPNIVESMEKPGLIAFIESIVPFVGIVIAYLCFYQKPYFTLIKKRMNSSTALAEKKPAMHQFLSSGWAMDSLYDKVLVNPFKALAAINKNDAIDDVYTGVKLLSKSLHKIFSWTQNGQLRRYGWVMVFGMVIIIGMGVLL